MNNKEQSEEQCVCVCVSVCVYISYYVSPPGCEASWALLLFLLKQRLDHCSPLGSSACLASLRRAAANPEFVDWATAFPLVSGLRGLTVAVVRVAVEIIPNADDLLDSWFIPEEEKGGGDKT